MATDGRRLAVNSHKDVKTKQDFKIIVPSKILNELVKFIKTSDFKEKDEVLIGLSSNQIGFKFDKTVFVSRLIEGNFPAYEQIIPKNPEISINLVPEVGMYKKWVLLFVSVYSRNCFAPIVQSTDQFPLSVS